MIDIGVKIHPVHGAEKKSLNSTLYSEPPSVYLNSEVEPSSLKSSRPGD